MDSFKVFGKNSGKMGRFVAKKFVPFLGLLFLSFGNQLQLHSLLQITT